MTTGSAGERAAAAFLKEKGYRILQTNFSCKQGEIDIVAEEGESLVFVEVKTRIELGEELPEAALTRSKKRKVARAAREFMRQYHCKKNLGVGTRSRTFSKYSKARSGLPAASSA